MFRVPPARWEHVRGAHRAARRVGDEPVDAGGAFLLRGFVRSRTADGAAADAREDLERCELAQGCGDDHRADRVRGGAHQDVRALQVQGEGSHHLRDNQHLFFWHHF